MKLLSPRCDHTLFKKDSFYYGSDSDDDRDGDEGEYEHDYDYKKRMESTLYNTEKKKMDQEVRVTYLPDFDHIVVIK